MEEKQEKEKGNFWLTVATFIVNKRKAIYVLFFIAIISILLFPISVSCLWRQPAGRL